MMFGTWRGRVGSQVAVCTKSWPRLMFISILPLQTYKAWLTPAMAEAPLPATPLEDCGLLSGAMVKGVD